MNNTLLCILAFLIGLGAYELCIQAINLHRRWLWNRENRIMNLPTENQLQERKRYVNPRRPI